MVGGAVPARKERSVTLASLHAPKAPASSGTPPRAQKGLVNKKECIKAELLGDFKSPACTGIARPADGPATGVPADPWKRPIRTPKRD